MGLITPSPTSPPSRRTRDKRLENILTVGVRFGLPATLQDVLRRRFFPDAQGRAWLLHNVEEVGNFEFSLPRLFAQETGRGSA